MGIVDDRFWHAKILFLLLKTTFIVSLLSFLSSVYVVLCGLITSSWQVTPVVSFLCIEYADLFGLGAGSVVGV